MTSNLARFLMGLGCTLLCVGCISSGSRPQGNKFGIGGVSKGDETFHNLHLLLTTGPDQGDYTIPTQEAGIPGTFRTDWPDYFGDVWNAGFNRVDFAMATAHDLGVTHLREFMNPIKIYKWVVTDPAVPAAPITVSDGDGWEMYDHVLAKARSYGMKVSFVLPYPYPTIDGGTAWGSWNAAAQNYYLPMAAFVAARYAKDSDILSLEPINEPDGYGQLGPDPHDWAKAQGAIYDVIKAQAPSMTVRSCSMVQTPGYSPDRHALGFLAALDELGLMNKFDEFNIHPYGGFAPQSIIDGGGWNTWSAGPGSGDKADLEAIHDHLVGYGRADAKVALSEWGFIWNDPPGAGGADNPAWKAYSKIFYTDFMNWVNASDWISSSEFYTFWGSNRPFTVPLLFGREDETVWVAFRGTGIADEYDRGATKFPPYDAIAEFHLR